ncbi:MAG TPA: glycosyltransferase, partial [Thermoanaerobaculia bacterium]|nr:glycosyltransferase [Thermoanaerobaculia bacterium]
MRVLFVLHAPRDPKAAVFAYAEERRAFLQAQGHEGEVWTPQDFPRLRRWHPRWLPLAYPWVVLRRLLRGPEAFDLVMFHSFAGWASLLARPFSARLEANSMVVQFHGLEPLYLAVTSAQAEASGRPFSLRFRLLAGPVMNALLRLSCRRADAVLVLNQAERNYLSSREWAEPERIAVVANAAPSAFLALREDAREPGRLLFLGQWLAAKGIAELVAAFSAAL